MLAKGARAIVAITAGLGEAGAEGRAREEALDRARPRRRAPSWSGPTALAWSTTPPRPTCPPTHSRPAASRCSARAATSPSSSTGCSRARGMGISRFVSLGNQADVDSRRADRRVRGRPGHRGDRGLRRGLPRRPRLRRTRRPQRSTPERRSWCSPPGASTAAARGAQSHTGSLTSDAAVIARRVHGRRRDPGAAPRASWPTCCSRCGSTAVPRGPRVAVLTDGGGHGVIACDVAEAAGLEVPALGEATQHAPARGAVGAVAASATRSTWPAPARWTRTATRAHSRCCRRRRCRRDPDDRLLRRLLQRRGRADRARPRRVRGGQADRGRRGRRQAGRGAVDLPGRTGLPDPRATAACRSSPRSRTPPRALAAVATPARRRRSLPLPARAAPVAATDYTASRAEFAAAGIDVRRCPRGAHSRGAGRRRGDELRAPYVLKALGLLHKSDAGGVVVGLASADEPARRARRAGRRGSTRRRSPSRRWPTSAAASS